MSRKWGAYSYDLQKLQEMTDQELFLHRRTLGAP